jgi:hypothetical protein
MPEMKKQVCIMIKVFGLPDMLSLHEIVKHHCGKNLNILAALGIGG